MYNINILYLFWQLWQLYEFIREHIWMNAALCRVTRSISMLYILCYADAGFGLIAWKNVEIFHYHVQNSLPLDLNQSCCILFISSLVASFIFNLWLYIYICIYVCIYIYIHIYIQRVPGGMCQTSGGCSLC